MRRMMLAPALVLALSATAFAEGDMQFGLTGAPTPTPTPPHLTGVVAGTHADCAMASEEADTLSETLLNLIDSVLALL